MYESLNPENLPEWLRSWPEWQVIAARDVAVLLAAWAVGAILAHIAAARLVTWGLGDLATLPWNSRNLDSKRSRKAGASFPSIAGFLVKASLVAVGVGWVANFHGWGHFGDALERLLILTWKIALLAGAALFVSRLVAAAVVDFLSASEVQGAIESLFPSGNSRAESSFGDTVTKVAGTFVYGMGFILLFLVAVDLFQWASLRSALLAIWDLGVHLATAAAVLAAGGVGVRWLSSLESPESAATPGNAPVPYAVALPGPAKPAAKAMRFQPFLVGLAVLIALAVLAGHLLSVVALLFLLVVIFVLALAFRDHLPDLFAGFILRYRGVTRIVLDGKPAVLVRNGLLASEWERDGVVLRRPNKSILDALLKPEAPEERPEESPQ